VPWICCGNFGRRNIISALLISAACQSTFIVLRASAQRRLKLCSWHVVILLYGFDGACTATLASVKLPVNCPFFVRSPPLSQNPYHLLSREPESTLCLWRLERPRIILIGVGQWVPFYSFELAHHHLKLLQTFRPVFVRKSLERRIETSHSTFKSFPFTIHNDQYTTC